MDALEPRNPYGPSWWMVLLLLPAFGLMGRLLLQGAWGRYLPLLAPTVMAIRSLVDGRRFPSVLHRDGAFLRIHSGQGERSEPIEDLRLRKGLLEHEVVDAHGKVLFRWPIFGSTGLTEWLEGQGLRAA